MYNPLVWWDSASLLSPMLSSILSCLIVNINCRLVKWLLSSEANLTSRFLLLMPHPLGGLIQRFDTLCLTYKIHLVLHNRGKGITSMLLHSRAVQNVDPKCHIYYLPAPGHTSKFHIINGFLSKIRHPYYKVCLRSDVKFTICTIQKRHHHSFRGLSKGTGILRIVL